jgi:inner membrane protein
MDLVTQGLLGAAVGTAVGARRLGWKAAVFGALGGLLPDSDVFFSQTPGVEHWVIHRGVTHSLWFGPLVGSALAMLSIGIGNVWRARQKQAPLDDAARRAWFAVWILAIFTHPLLDAVTQYGTQWFAPFTDWRAAIAAMPIIDPLYSLLLIGGLVAAAFTTGQRAEQRARIALGLSCAYIAVAAVQQPLGAHMAHKELTRQGLNGPSVLQVSSHTTMFTPFLRRVVARTEDGYLIGFVSTLNPQPIQWRRVEVDPVAQRLADQILSGEGDGRRYRRFATGPIVPEILQREDGAQVLRLHDARYGFPGQSLTGQWGLEYTLNEQGRPVGRGVRYRIPREATGERIEALMRAKLGLPNAVF